MADIIKCSCSHKGQDSLHGSQMRVCNKDQKGTTATCTVCGAKHKTK
jgi:hypothetical protein